MMERELIDHARAHDLDGFRHAWFIKTNYSLTPAEAQKLMRRYMSKRLAPAC